MSPLQGFLDEREDEGPTREDRERAAEAWQISGGKAPEVRLLAFDKWVRLELAARIDWSWAGAQKERRIEQCRLRLEQMVLNLWRRGWMLDGRKLAARIEALLDTVAAYQRKGEVRDFWAYFGASVDRYVGANAEEIQIEAMGAGAKAANWLKALGVERQPEAPKLPELVAQRAAEIVKVKAETLREKQSRERARQAACKADANQPTLF